MIVSKAIKASRLKDEAMRMALLNGMRKVGRDTVKEYEKTFETWSNKPKAEFLISLSGEGPTVVAGIGGNEKAAKHWRYLNEGTSVRHAVMSSDWKSKTVPNIIGSFSGEGEVVFVSRKINLPGIEARNFDKLIEKEMKPRFKREMEEAMRKAAKASGHGV
jgi:predicted amidohydrolase